MKPNKLNYKEMMKLSSLYQQGIKMDETRQVRAQYHRLRRHRLLDVFKAECEA